jgi:1,2-beta-oligoglucan phosphorylase
VCADGQAVRYRSPQQLFRRAESASFFGREIGLMYVHAHLGYAEALAVLGEADELWEALLVVNPIAVADRLANSFRPGRAAGHLPPVPASGFWRAGD